MFIMVQFELHRWPLVRGFFKDLCIKNTKFLLLKSNENSYNMSVLVWSTILKWDNGYRQQWISEQPGISWRTLHGIAEGLNAFFGLHGAFCVSESLSASSHSVSDSRPDIINLFTFNFL